MEEATTETIVDGEPTEILEQSIRSGSTVLNGRGAVQITIARADGTDGTNCSGALLNGKTILTAAHCLVHLTNGGAASVFAYKTVEGKRKCISSGGTEAGGAACWAWRAATVRWDRDYSGKGDFWHDFGVIVLDRGSWGNGVITTDYMDIYMSSASAVRSFEAFGYGDSSFTDGEGSGVLRRANKYINVYSDRQLVDTNIEEGQPRMCAGDSGGPALAQRDTFPGHPNRILLGTHCGNLGNVIDNCTHVGEDEYWNRTGTRIAAIESWLSRSCTELKLRDAGGTQRTLRRCW
jgi:hypothetical protein